MNDAWHLAIDFGTSNTSAAHTAPLTQAVEALALSHRSNLMPSTVFMEDNAAVTGLGAIASGRRQPERLVMAPKRFIDHDVVQVAGKDYAVTTVIAAVLNNVLFVGKSQHANQDPATVTLTHPEAWSIHSIERLKESAAQAGVDARSIRTISEPRAAAIHYAAQQKVESGKHVAVFDFGGGTLDIAVLQARADGNFAVVSAKGDNSLGGRTIDNLLFRWVLAQLEQDDPEVADQVKNAPPAAMHQLQTAITEAKELLSDSSSATISVPTPDGKRDLLITRDEFNGIIDHSVVRGMELTRAALEQAGVDSRETPIYLTGGSSRIPHVQNRLAQLGNVMTLDDPKTVVSRGALVATLRGFSDGSVGPIQNESRNPQRADTAGTATMPQANAQQNPYGAPRHVDGQPVPQYGNAGGAQGGGNGTASNNPFGQTSNGIPRQAQGQQPAATVPASAAQGKKSGRNLALPIIGGLLVVGLIGGGIYAFNQMGKGEKEDHNGVAPTSASSPASSMTTKASTSASSPAASAPKSSNAAATAGKDRGIDSQISGASSFLPAEFVSKLRTCSDPKATTSKVLSGADNINASPCLMDKEKLGEHKEEGAYSLLKYAYKDADAQKAYDYATKNSKYEDKKLQNAGNGLPELHMFQQNGGVAELMAWYPDQKVAIIWQGDSSTKDEDSVKRVFTYFGFRK